VTPWQDKEALTAELAFFTFLRDVCLWGSGLASGVFVVCLGVLLGGRI